MIGLALALLGQEAVAVPVEAAPVAVETATPAPAVPPACAPGIYADTGTLEVPILAPIASAAMEKRQVTNVGGFLLTGGISGLRIKSVLPGPNAPTRLAQPRPAFRFCFEPPQAVAANGDGSAYVGTARSAASPAEYRLVLFERDDDQRELVIARSRMLSGITGTMADHTLRFDSTEIAPGQYRVTVDYDLPPGEYGFLLAVGGGDFRNNQQADSAGLGGIQQGARVYDFAVIRR